MKYLDYNASEVALLIMQSDKYRLEGAVALTFRTYNAADSWGLTFERILDTIDRLYEFIRLIETDENTVEATRKLFKGMPVLSSISANFRQYDTRPYYIIKLSKEGFEAYSKSELLRLVDRHVEEMVILYGIAMFIAALASKDYRDNEYVKLSAEALDMHEDFFRYNIMNGFLDDKKRQLVIDDIAAYYEVNPRGDQSIYNEYLHVVGRYADVKKSHYEEIAREFLTFEKDLYHDATQLFRSHTVIDPDAVNSVITDYEANLQSMSILAVVFILAGLALNPDNNEPPTMIYQAALPFIRKFKIDFSKEIYLRDLITEDPDELVTTRAKLDDSSVPLKKGW